MGARGSWQPAREGFMNEKAPAKGLDVTIRFIEGGDALRGHVDPHKKRPAQDDFAARAFAKLTPEMRAAFVANDKKLLEWLGKSAQNRARFAMDPIDALREALPGFDPKLLEQLRAMRGASARVPVAMPGVRIASLKFEMADGRRGRP
jgi:hypothetical protein